jgi:hypothetical protein
VTLVSWAAGQLLLRLIGLRWWKLALVSLAAIATVIAVEGGPAAALAHHFSGYAGWLRQIGVAQLDYPTPGAFFWPQLPLAVPVGLLAAALNLAGRRQAIDPAEVKRTQREATRSMDAAVKRAANVRDDHFGPVALGVQVDGDLGWADEHGLVVVPQLMQSRSRLIVGTSGTGKTTDIEREAFRAARDGRKFFLIDGKGTDPGFVERALAGYLWGNPHAHVALWPELPMDGWRGNPAAIHNRLLAMLAWTEPYYQDVASLLLRLALNAPGEDGPVRSSSQLMARMDPELLVRLYEHDPDRLTEAQSLVGRDQARAVKGAVGRFANFFAATSGGFDAAEQGWSFEDVDFAYLRAPYLAGRQDADAAMRLLLEDFAHYATLRKPRRSATATGHAPTPWWLWPAPGGPRRSSRVPAPGSRPKVPPRAPWPACGGIWQSSRHPTAWGRTCRQSRHGRHRPAIGCGWRWLPPPATATRTPPPPWSAKALVTASRRPSW